MANMSALAGMLAQSGQAAGQQIGAGLAGLGGGIGGMLSRRQEAKKQEERNRGIIGGNMAIQQAAQKGEMSQEMLRSYAGSMQGLGVPPEEILRKVNELQQLNASAKQKGTTGKFINKLGSKYAELFEASGDFKAAYNQYLADTQQANIAALAKQLDPSLSDELAATMTSSDLVDLYEGQKKEDGARKWAEWQGKNPQITDENRQQAIMAAVAAHGKDAPKIVADLEAKQLKIKADKEGKKSVPVLITMKDNAMFVDPMSGGRKKLTTEKLPVNPDGTLSPEAKKWLEAHAASAMVQDTGEFWPPDPVDTSETPPPPPPPPGEGTTLSQLLSPDLQKKLINTQIQD